MDFGQYVFPGPIAQPAPARASRGQVDGDVPPSRAGTQQPQYTLQTLAVVGPAAARLVELRYFAGLTIAEAGKAIGISTATAYRHWNYARAWLHGELQG